MWQLITAILYCEYNYYCYECHYKYNTKTHWMDFFQVDSTTCWNMYVSDPSSSKQRVWLQHISLVFQFFFNLLFNSSSWSWYSSSTCLLTCHAHYLTNPPPLPEWVNFNRIIIDIKRIGISRCFKSPTLLVTILSSLLFMQMRQSITDSDERFFRKRTRGMYSYNIRHMSLNVEVCLA